MGVGCCRGRIEDSILEASSQSPGKQICAFCLSPTTNNKKQVIGGLKLQICSKYSPFSQRMEMSSPFSFDSLIQFFLSYHLSMIADRLSLLSIRTLPIKHFRWKQKLECLSRPLAARYAKNYTSSLLKKSIVKLLNRAELIFQVFIQISDFSVTI